MVIYWRHQFIIDAIIVAILAIVLSAEAASQLFVAPSDEAIVQACRVWLAPILTLLGLVCATTAFLFTAIERTEFDLLRSLNVEGQLWSVFSEIIFWLAVAAVSSASISLAKNGDLPDWVTGFAVFLFLIVALCLLKFAWLMRHIIAVRKRKSA